MTEDWRLAAYGGRFFRKSVFHRCNEYISTCYVLVNIEFYQPTTLDSELLYTRDSTTGVW